MEIPWYLTKAVSEMVNSVPDVVDLSRGQAGFSPPEEAYKAYRKILEGKDIYKYESMAGSSQLRHSIAQWYGRLYDLDINYQDIVIVNGGSGGLSTAMQFFTKRGDTIVIPDPAYPYYELGAKYTIDLRNVIRISIGESPLTRDAISSIPISLIVLTSPHNPTGVVYEEASLRELINTAYDRGFYILSDENHFPEIYNGRKHLPIISFDQDRSILVGSLSRLGLQGLRIGWVILPAGMAENFSMLCSIYNLSVNTAAQRLASWVFDNYENMGFESYFQEYEKCRNWFIPELNKIEGFSCRIPEATPYAFVDVSKFNKGDPQWEKRKCLALGYFAISYIRLRSVVCPVTPTDLIAETISVSLSR